MIRCVGIILVRSDGSVLAQHRDNKPEILNPNTWAVISGGMETGIDKNLIATCIRELREETDYVADPKDLRYLARDTYKPANIDITIERTVMWAFYDGVQPVNCNEGQETRFIRPQEFKDLVFAKGHEVFFRKASEKAFYSRLERRI